GIQGNIQNDKKSQHRESGGKPPGVTARLPGIYQHRGEKQSDREQLGQLTILNKPGLSLAGKNF
ncbi:hypothetical protein DPR96_15610, partial [Salmonella enterica subsp. enterica]|nr:hypothetical protein [Salmonella enterica subsp. enterica serovar Muenster]